MVVVVMGAAGAGKTTVGRALADELGWPFVDADELHSPAAVEKMRAGRGLNDGDRAPWLARVREAIASRAASGESAVIACSALKTSYRATMTAGVGTDVRFVFLHADRGLLHRRLAARVNHYAGAALLDSQLADLEAPGADALTLDASLPTDVLVHTIREQLSI